MSLLENALDDISGSQFRNLRLYLLDVDSKLDDILDRLGTIETKLQTIIVPESGNILVSVEEYERFKELMARMEITRKEYEDAIVKLIATYRR